MAYFGLEKCSILSSKSLVLFLCVEDLMHCLFSCGMQRPVKRNNKLLEGEKGNIKCQNLNAKRWSTAILFPFLPHRDKMHVDWVKAYVSIWTDLQNYIKQHHTTGLTWSKSVSSRNYIFPLPLMSKKVLRQVWSIYQAASTYLQLCVGVTFQE